MAFRYTSAAAIPADFRQVAESVLGPVDWTDEHSGYCKCPGAHRHTTPTRERDCRVYLDADNGHAPTVHCFHGSCADEITTANFALRSTIGKAAFRKTGQLGNGAYTSPRPAAITDPFAQFLNACFQPEDILSIAPGMVPEGETRAVPEHGGVNLFTRDQWLEKARAKGGIQRLFSGRDGLFVRINPVTPKSNGADKDVTAFRHVLVESDKLPKERQERILRDSGLPIAALIDSGAHSVHAWVRVDAESTEQFHERREKVWASLPGFEIDPANRNPSRYSRCPGGLRGDAVQRLLAVNLGPKSYAEWERTQSGLPAIVCAADFCAEDEADPPLLIDGLLYRGSKMIIAGPSKARKSWNLIDLAVAISTGGEWCGFKTLRSRVLYVNLEIQRFSYRKRIKHVAQGRSLATDQLTGFHAWNLRGHDAEISKLVNDVLAKVSQANFDLIIIDPIYKTYGERQENSNTEMAQVLAELEKLALRANVAVLIAAHFPKGNLTGRDAIDRIAGASVFGRDPDVLLTMTTHEIEDAFAITPILRDLPPQGEFVVRWNGHRFERIDADPKSIEGREKPREKKPRGAGFIPGSYREMFAHMPPLRNGSDPSQSEVLAHIAAELNARGKDANRAYEVFEMIRNPRRKIIVFDHQQQVWKGVLHGKE
jgi:RecA-family ATPase